MNLAYCDKIAYVIRNSLIQSHRNGLDPELHIGPIGPIEMDLHPEKGYFMSTKKTMSVTDMNGKTYKVTVEEQND